MYTKEAFESIINAVADPIFVKDRQHNWVLLNDSFCRFIGHSRQELIGKSDYEFFPKAQADVFWDKDEAVFLSGVENLNEEYFTDAGGILHTIATKKGLFVDNLGNKYIVGIIRDVTDIKQANAIMIKQASELAKSEAEREHLEFFAYVAAHDLRDPLQRIIGFSDLLKNLSYETLCEEGRKYLQKIQDASSRMSSLIDDLLRFSKVIKRSEMFSKVNLSAVLDRVIEDLDLSIRHTQAVIDVGPLPEISGDESQLTQLFQNLIANAIKFRKDNQPPKITIGASEGGSAFWEISIADEGIGFDPQYADKIFRPFERLHNRGQYEGSGIGLAICQKIVSYHNGKISVQTHPQKGTIFSILLPRS